MSEELSNNNWLSAIRLMYMKMAGIRFYIISFLIILSPDIFSQDYIKYSSMIENLQVKEECKQNLSKIYSQGKTLFVEKVAKLGKLLKNYNSEKPHGKRLKHNYFFHYTNYPYTETDSFLKDKDIFPYFKKRDLHGFGTNSFGASLYIANDPYSSTDFGKFLIRLKLSENATVLHEKDLLAIDWDTLADELSEVTKSCDIEELKPIIVEDSGIDLVQYVDNHSNAIWLQLLNSKAIIEARYSKTPRRLKRGFRRSSFNYNN